MLRCYNLTFINTWRVGDVQVQGFDEQACELKTQGRVVELVR